MYLIEYTLFLFIVLQICETSRSQSKGVLDCSKAPWSYRKDCSGPRFWRVYQRQHCSLYKQSPINLRYSTAVYDSHLSMPIIKRADDSPESFGKYKLRNTGYGITLSFPDKEWELIYPESRRIYIISEIDWHWGNYSSSRGSEHCIEREFSDMEGHLIAYNGVFSKDFNNPAISIKAFAILYNMKKESVRDPIMDNITSTFSVPFIQRKAQDSEKDYVEIDGFDIRYLLPMNIMRFFRYEGTLTTPPCHQNVIWTVFESEKLISEENLNKFRSLIFQNGDPMIDNIRPLEPVNTAGGDHSRRIVTKSFPGSASKLKISSSIVIAFGFSTLNTFIQIH